MTANHLQYLESTGFFNRYEANRRFSGTKGTSVRRELSSAWPGETSARVRQNNFVNIDKKQFLERLTAGNLVDPALLGNRLAEYEKLNGSATSTTLPGDPADSSEQDPANPGDSMGSGGSPGVDGGGSETGTNHKPANSNDALSLSRWLVNKKLITGWQCEILLAGHAGPFNFGGYQLLNRLCDGPISGQFEARHLATGFPVLLTFFEGVDDKSLDQWNQIEKLVSTVQSIDDPNLASVHDCVVLPAHRFVSSKAAIGRPLSSVLSPSGRLPVSDACRFAAVIAAAVKTMHTKGMIHNAISPRSIWMQSKKSAYLRMTVSPDVEFDKPPEGQESPSGHESKYDYLAPEVTGDEPEVSAASDFYSLGCVLFRMLTGRTVFSSENVHDVIEGHRSRRPPSLAKMKLPAPVEQLVTELLNKDPAQRPADHDSVIQTLHTAAGISNAQGEPERSASSLKMQAAEARYRNWIARNKPGGIDVLSDKRVAGAPEITDGTAASIIVDSTAPVTVNSGPDNTTGSFAPDKDAASSARTVRKKNKPMLPIVIASSLLLLGSVVGGVAFWANGLPIASNENGDDPSGEGSDGTGSVDEEPAGNTVAVDLTPVWVEQTLIPDDRSSLWETPTAGPNIDFTYVPDGPRMLFVFRPGQMLADPGGELLLRSLGPRMNSRIANWQARTGVALSEIDQVIVSLHSTGNEYAASYVVRLERPVSISSLSASWQGATASETSGGSRIFNIGGQSYFPVPGGDANSTLAFVHGPTNLVTEVADSGGASVLSGSLQNLTRWTDRERDFTLLFLRQALVNQEGQELMAGPLQTFNRKLDFLMPDALQGAMISLHLEGAQDPESDRPGAIIDSRASYFEMVLDQSLDVKSGELKTQMEASMRTQRDLLNAFVSSIPRSAYWDNVRLRFPLMVGDFYRNLRWGVENDRVVANCWLPAAAAHNLIAASEHILTFGSSAGSSVADSNDQTNPMPDGSGGTGTEIPHTLEELLQTRRSLNLTTNPDLVVLLSDFRDELSDDFGELPFPLAIRLIGNDLQRDGITQNQRPGRLKLDDKSVAEILTEIMVRCNPNKDISGAGDLNCKLVWAIGDDPEQPGQNAILITTRQGVLEKELTLPAAFQIKE